MSEADENQMTIADALEAAPEKPKRGRKSAIYILKK